MKLEKDDAKIGLLVFLALAVFAGFLFHRSLTAILTKETPYQVALETASDLSEGTEVQLQGLRVGQVKGIRLQRDGVEYRFLATLGLRTDIVLWQGTRAVVVAKPLGGSFVDLQLPEPPLRLAVLQPGATLRGAASASLATLLEDASHLIANLDGTVTDLRGPFRAKGAGAVLDSPRIAKVLADLDETLLQFRKLALEGQTLARHGDASMAVADRSLVNLDKSLATVQGLLDKRSGDLDAIVAHLADTLRESGELAKEARALLKTAGPGADAALKALDRNLRSTEELLEILKAKPNRIVWGKPSQAERDDAARRAEENRKK